MMSSNEKKVSENQEAFLVTPCPGDATKKKDDKRDDDDDDRLNRNPKGDHEEGDKDD